MKQLLNNDVSLSKSYKKIALAGVFFTAISFILSITIINFVDYKRESNNLELEYLANKKSLIKQEVLRTSSYINNLQEKAKKEINALIKAKTYNANSIDERILNINRDLKKIALDYIKQVKFGVNSYIFVVSYSGTVIMNVSQPHLIGKNIWNLEDPNGFKVIQAERKAVENPEGDFIYYVWNKPATSAPSPKVSFMYGIQDWQWMIGAGVYIDDVNKEIFTLKENLQQKLIIRLIISLAIASIIALFIIYLINRVTSSFDRKILQFTHIFNKYQNELKKIEADELQYSELKTIATAANNMLSARNKAEKQQQLLINSLAKSEALFRGLLENDIHGVLLLNAQGTIILANTKLLEMTGYKREELVGEFVEKLIADQFHHHHEQQRKDFIEKHQSRFMGTGLDIFMLCKSGNEMPVDISLTSIKTTDGYFVSAVIEDISERVKDKEKLIHQATFDTLTKLPNRFLIKDRLNQLIIEAKRNNKLAAIIYLDIDDFKKINDTLGHETGDQILIQASNRLKDIVRDCDTVGRLGGDEFIILLGNLIESKDASSVAESIINKFREVFHVDGYNLIATLSIGIALYPIDGESDSELLRNADSAMYYSKKIGRNTYSYFAKKMNKAGARRLAIEEQMHEALNRQEFEVYYQPQINLVSNKIIGAEALLRWQNPKLGFISPDEFIPIAEKTGLIVPIGYFVLSQALEATKQWHQSFKDDFRIAINLSPRQFRESDFLTTIDSIIKQQGVPRKFIELEITEGIFMDGNSNIDDMLEKMSNSGISIAMDDFGTGYSSLSYLRNYPFDVIKVDRIFISEMDTNIADKNLTDASIRMAHALNLEVVAEGIETDEHCQLLKEMNCDIGQGYLFSKPITKTQMEALLNSNYLYKPKNDDQ